MRRRIEGLVAGAVSVAVWLAVAMLVCAPALAGGPCYSGVCHKPAYTYQQTYHQPVYQQPVYQQAVYQPPPVYVAPVPAPQVINNLIAVPVPMPYLQPIAKQGDTVYGYSSLASVFPTYDPAAVMASAERLAVAGNDLARDGLSAYQTMHAGEVDAKERVATILATSQAFREITSEISRIQSQKLRTQSFSNGLAGAGGGATQGSQRTQARVGESATSADQVLQSRCASCHESYRVWDNLTANKQDEILERLTSDVPEERMPRLADKKTPAKAIPLSELSLLMDSRKSKGSR